MPTAARTLVDQLIALGADVAFGVPGESYLAVLDALYDTPRLRFVTCRHEGGAAFAAEDVAVVGLHTVFEHHEAMRPASLAAFLHEWRIRFPVGVDAPSEDAHDPVPQTMRAYALQGTPSLLLIDRLGHLRRHGFGAEDDLSIGAAVATLLSERD